jgi:demethylmenaquinone methyltransferase / 2-methoxy-6-polyprenyl-1,4-benzoquinol methylase
MNKSVFVKHMFDDIATRYDLLNDILSFGTHRLWKSKVVTEVMKNKPGSVLDCATGTGDLAFMFEQKGCADVTAIDFSEEMIDCAKKRAVKENSKVTFFAADITKLPFKDKFFAATTVSFGVRNVEDLALGLKELSRVSGSLYILEFGQPENKIAAKAYFNLLKLYVPLFGLISGRKDAYEYLIASSEQFPSRQNFIKIMKENSDHYHFSFKPIFGGIAYLYESHGAKK